MAHLAEPLLDANLSSFAHVTQLTMVYPVHTANLICFFLQKHKNNFASTPLNLLGSLPIDVLVFIVNVDGGGLWH